MQTSRFATRLLSAVIAAAVVLATQNSRADEIDPAAFAKQLAQIEALTKQLAQLDPASDTSAPRSEGGRQNASINLQSGGLRVSSLQSATSLHLAARGLTADENWLQLFPRKKH